MCAVRAVCKGFAKILGDVVVRRGLVEGVKGDGTCWRSGEIVYIVWISHTHITTRQTVLRSASLERSNLKTIVRGSALSPQKIFGF